MTIKPRTAPVSYGRHRYGRTAEAMAAASLKLAGIFRRGGSLDAARAWLADAKAWRTGRYGVGIHLPSLGA